MRLIDADVANRWMERNGAYIDTEILKAIPTVDAVIVTHGHWETNSDIPDTLICSVCKCGFDMWKHDPHNFCPNCGSRMNGDKNDAVD